MFFIYDHIFTISTFLTLHQSSVAQLRLMESFQRIYRNRTGNLSVETVKYLINK